LLLASDEDTAKHCRILGQGLTMPFSFSTWLHRKRVLAELTLSGRSVQPHRVTNPYHAVSIKTGPYCGQTKQLFGERRFLSAAAPVLPQPTCSPTACRCMYLHHEDRRAEPDRRLHDVWDPNAPLAHGRDRRQGRGRRATDR
jgi:hypothetical protein